MDNEDNVRERTYYLWEAAGRPEGQADEHWVQARKTAELAGEIEGELSARTEFETDDLSEMLSRETCTCWFAAKDWTIDSLRLVTPAAQIDQFGPLTQVEVPIGGGIERYSMPLAIVWDAQRTDSGPFELARKMAIARVHRRLGQGVLTDAFFVPESIRSLVGKAMSGAVHRFGGRRRTRFHA